MSVLKLQSFPTLIWGQRAAATTWQQTHIWRLFLGFRSCRENINATELSVMCCKQITAPSLRVSDSGGAEKNFPPPPNCGEVVFGHSPLSPAALLPSSSRLTWVITEDGFSITSRSGPDKGGRGKKSAELTLLKLRVVHRLLLRLVGAAWTF